MKRDRFDDYHILSEDIQMQDFALQLQNVIHSLNDEISTHALWVTLTIDQFGYSKALKETGFKVHFARCLVPLSSGICFACPDEI